MRKYGVEDQAKLGMRTLLDRGCTCVGCLLAGAGVGGKLHARVDACSRVGGENCLCTYFNFLEFIHKFA